MPKRVIRVPLDAAVTLLAISISTVGEGRPAETSRDHSRSLKLYQKAHPLMILWEWEFNGFVPPPG